MTIHADHYQKHRHFTTLSHQKHCSRTDLTFLTVVAQALHQVPTCVQISHQDHSTVCLF